MPLGRKYPKTDLGALAIMPRQAQAPAMLAGELSLHGRRGEQHAAARRS